MLTTPTLTAQEVKHAEDALASLTNLRDTVQFMDARNIASILDSNVNKLNAALERIRVDETASRQEHDEYYAGVAERQCLGSRWAVYEAGMNKMGHTPHAGTWEIIFKDAQGFTFGPSPLMEDPSWLALWKAADELLQQSPHGNHHTITGFVLDGEYLRVEIA